MNRTLAMSACALVVLVGALVAGALIGDSSSDEPVVTLPVPMAKRGEINLYGPDERGWLRNNLTAPITHQRLVHAKGKKDKDGECEYESYHGPLDDATSAAEEVAKNINTCETITVIGDVGPGEDLTQPVSR